MSSARSVSASRTRPKLNCSRYRTAPWISLLDRDDVPEAKSLASTSPTDRPQVAASSATPAPTTPPPTTSTCSSEPAIAAIAEARSAGPSLTAPNACVVTVQNATQAPAAGSSPGRCGRPACHDRRARGHRDLDPLELLQVRVPGGRHRPAERAHQVHRAVGYRRRAVQDLLESADRADPEPVTARQFRVMRFTAPVIAPAGRLRRPGDGRADHDRVGADRQRLGDVAAAGHPAIRDHA